MSKIYSLYQIVYDLSEKTNDIAANYILNLFNWDTCKVIDGEIDNYIVTKRKDCVKLLKKCKIDYAQNHKTAFDIYNEIGVYMELRNRCNIKGLIEKKDLPMPDYLFVCENGSHLNLDLKTISANNDIPISENSEVNNFVNYQKQSLRSKIEIEAARLNPFIPFRFTPVIFSAFKKSDLNIYRKNIIETFIDKTTNNYKPAQLKYEGNNGILIIDTVIFGFPFFVQEGLPTYYHPLLGYATHRSFVSGCLWNACFGETGNKTYDFVTETGQPNIRENLEKNGVLINDSSFEAVIYIIRQGGNSKGRMQFIGFHKKSLSKPDIRECLYNICDFVNDEVNSYSHCLSIDPLDNYKFQ